MEILFLILLIAYVIVVILDIKVDKQRNNLIEEILDFNKRLVDERNKIINILIYAEITKENYFETIDKIKNELAIDRKS